MLEAGEIWELGHGNISQKLKNLSATKEKEWYISYWKTDLIIAVECYLNI